MPQFDFTTYSSQIFWFAICFLTLYFFAHSIILPRIRKIINERETTINNDVELSNSLEEKLGEVEIKTEALRRKATQEYQAQIDEAAKVNTAKREKLLEELKAKIEKITDKSHEDLKKFVTESKAKSQAAFDGLVKSIKEKVFNA